MIANWTREDVELLTRARLIWHGRADWRGIEKNWTGSKWRLVIENADGERPIIGHEDVASGAARITRIRPQPLDLTRGLPSTAMGDTLKRIRDIVRKQQLATPISYA